MRRYSSKKLFKNINRRLKKFEGFKKATTATEGKLVKTKNKKF